MREVVALRPNKLNLYSLVASLAISIVLAPVIKTEGSSLSIPVDCETLEVLEPVLNWNCSSLREFCL